MRRKPSLSAEALERVQSFWPWCQVGNGGFDPPTKTIETTKNHDLECHNWVISLKYPVTPSSLSGCWPNRRRSVYSRLDYHCHHSERNECRSFLNWACRVLMERCLMSRWGMFAKMPPKVRGTSESQGLNWWIICTVTIHQLIPIIYVYIYICMTLPTFSPCETIIGERLGWFKKLDHQIVSEKNSTICMILLVLQYVDCTFINISLCQLRPRSDFLFAWTGTSK